MMKPGQKTETQVTWEDQSKINTFSRLSSKYDKIEDQYQANLKEKEYLDDVMQEMELFVDETVRYRLGDCFEHIKSEVAVERLELEMMEISKIIDGQKEQMDQISTQMNELKQHLYSKFGNSINLER